MLEITVIYYPLLIKGLIHGISQDKNVWLPSFKLKGVKKGIAFGFDYSTSSNLLLKSPIFKSSWAVRIELSLRMESSTNTEGLCLRMPRTSGYLCLCGWEHAHGNSASANGEDGVKQFLC